MFRICLISTILVATLFAGCTGSSTDDPQEAGSDDPLVVTRPDDYSYLDDENEASRGHLHDYWNGQDTLVAIDDTFPIGCFYCGTEAPAFRYQADEGGIVPGGTRWVDITLSWTTTSEASYSTPHLWVKTAAEHEPWDAGAIENGGTVQIEVDDSQNDIPHETLSSWVFEMRVGSPAAGTPYHVQGEASLLVVVTKGHPIPVYPRHPDLWGNETEILLFDQSGGADTVTHRSREFGTAGTQWLEAHVPDDGKVVPYDMDHLELTVTYEDDAPLRLELVFHGAGSREETTLGPTETDGTTHTYRITPEDGAPDGPYATQSQWMFRFYTRADQGHLFTGDYTIKAVVYQGAV